MPAHKKLISTWNSGKQKTNRNWEKTPIFFTCTLNVIILSYLVVFVDFLSLSLCPQLNVKNYCVVIAAAAVCCLFCNVVRCYWSMSSIGRILITIVFVMLCWSQIVKQNNNNNNDTGHRWMVNSRYNWIDSMSFSVVAVVLGCAAALFVANLNCYKLAKAYYRSHIIRIGWRLFSCALFILLFLKHCVFDVR